MYTSHGPKSRERRRTRLVRWLGRTWARVQYARRIEPTWLELVDLDIPLRGLHTALDGFRIVQLSDFHLDRRLGSEHVRQSIRLANQCEPDVVALTGDFVHKGFRYVELVAQLVGELQATRGVFAVLGNHDHAQRNAWLGRRSRLAVELTRALESHGVQVLRNQAVTVGAGHSRLAIAGIDDLWSRQADVDQALAEVPAGIPRIVLAHNPRTIEHLGEHRCDVMLSGHTHGGQVNLPRAGSPMLPPGMRRYRAGLYECEGRYLYVNKGVGCGLRVRYRTRPEVAVLRLVPGTVGA